MDLDIKHSRIEMDDWEDLEFTQDLFESEEEISKFLNSLTVEEIESKQNKTKWKFQLKKKKI